MSEAIIPGMSSRRRLPQASRRAILDEGLIAPKTIVGEEFEYGEICVPEMLVAARALRAGLSLLDLPGVAVGQPVMADVGTLGTQAFGHVTAIAPTSWMLGGTWSTRSLSPWMRSLPACARACPSRWHSARSPEP